MKFILFFVMAFSLVRCGSRDESNLSDSDQVCHINSVGMQFCLIPKGTFMMGSPTDEAGREGSLNGGIGRQTSDETQHQVTLTKDFEMQITEVTQTQWQEIMGTNPSRFPNPDGPVDSISWEQVSNEFLPKLSQRIQGDGYVYRLPTEAEWEYAARGGTTGSYGVDGNYDNFMWYRDNSASLSHSVRLLKANKFRLHDMHGNISEWVQDTYASYPSKPVTDPVVSFGSNHVRRGGSFGGKLDGLRSAARYADRFVYGAAGFRVARTKIN